VRADRVEEPGVVGPMAYVGMLLVRKSEIGLQARHVVDSVSVVEVLIPVEHELVLL